MKYKQHLRDNIAPEYGPSPYIDYGHLDDIIRNATKEFEQYATTRAPQTRPKLSLTTPAPTDSRGQVHSTARNFSEEKFFKALDKEMEKVETFTNQMVDELKLRLSKLQSDVSSSKHNGSMPADEEEFKSRGDAIGTELLRLEKYVNLNFMGFHKILKKHDKHLPGNPCRAFYIARMQRQSWVTADYSVIVVQLSSIYSDIRGDDIPTNDGSDDKAQSFVRSTTKYWVKMEDVSAVKYAVLQHLPVFLQKTSTGQSDSQLTNSVYLDNASLELYHGRLNKTEGAIAVRLRWYGNIDPPDIVFVERKTHRDAWTGEISVKERFIIREKEVKDIMNDTYDIKSAKAKMIEKGSSQEEVEDWEILVREILQAIQAKQLVPTMRTQYMRTAFQIPFDATVRVSLDTNLCMISERGYDLQGGKQWHRDPDKPITETDIIRFPHAILEVKLQLNEGDPTPEWVTELLSSGMLYEVHKFSKFIHGCAALLHEDVQSVPYWVDDASLVESFEQAGAKDILQQSDSKSFGRGSAGPGANQLYQHLLPFGTTSENRENSKGRTASSIPEGPKGTMKPRTAAPERTPLLSKFDHHDDEEDGLEYACFCNPYKKAPSEYLIADAPTSIQKVEPKIFFANERTFLHYLHCGAVLASLAAALLSFSDEESWAQWYALAMLPVAFGFVAYALHTFRWRAEMIRLRVPARWDDPFGPIVLCYAMVFILSVNFFAKIYDLVSLSSEL